MRCMHCQQHALLLLLLLLLQEPVPQPAADQ
jgi:hypothetical protein